MAKAEEFQCHWWKNYRVCAKKIKMSFAFTRDPVWLMALEVTPSLIQQDCKGSNFWAVRFMHCKGLAVCWRTTLAYKLPTDHLEKLIAYQHEIINLHQKHDYVLGRVLRMNPQSFWYSSQHCSTCKRIKIVVVKTTGHDRLITVMTWFLAVGRKLALLVFLKKKNLLKDFS